MKLTVKAGALRAELALAMTIVQDKPPIPSTAGVLVEAEPLATRATLSATDTALALRGHFEAKIEVPGQMVLPGRKLFEILKTLGLETDVAIAQDAKGTTVQADRFKSKLQSFQPEDYPKIPNDEGLPGFTFERAVLREIIARTRFCVKGTGSNAYDQSAQLILLASNGKDGARMTIAATDGHRLAVASGPGPQIAAPVTELIPRQALTQLAQMLDGDGPDVEFSQTEQHLFFRLGERLIVSRRMDGKFPLWEKIVPKNTLALEADRQSFLAVLRRVALIVEGVGTKQVKFSLGKDRLTMAAANATVGEGEDSVVASYADKATEVGLNPGYVADFLDVADGETVRMEAGGKADPVLFRPAGAGADSYLYVVMPMSLM